MGKGNGRKVDRYADGVSREMEKERAYISPKGALKFPKRILGKPFAAIYEFFLYPTSL